jgi:hypothetical protein
MPCQGQVELFAEILPFLYLGFPCVCLDDGIDVLALCVFRKHKQKGLKRMHYYAHLDRQTPEEARLDETFQVVSIEDDDGNNYMESIGIDPSTHFYSLEELAEEIERRTGEPAELDET